MLCRVSPFGHLRVIGYVLLAAAFRSLSRPSSALSAKASTLRSFVLDPPPPSVAAWVSGNSVLPAYPLEVAENTLDVLSSVCGCQGAVYLKSQASFFPFPEGSPREYFTRRVWQPPALPCRYQHSTIGRTGLDRRVRNGNG